MEPPINVSQFKVFFHLMFNFSDPRSTLAIYYLHLMFFFNLVFESAALQRILMWYFHYIFIAQFDMVRFLTTMTAELLMELQNPLNIYLKLILLYNWN